MNAGFSKICITPRSPTRMIGFSERDVSGVFEGVHDDLFARVAWFDHEGQEALVVCCDVAFFSRSQADRFVGAMARTLDLRPRQILLNASHTHSGPMLDMGVWTYSDYLEPEWLYIEQLERSLLEAAESARDSVRPVTLWAGRTTCPLPVSRRLPDADGIARWRPNPHAEVYDEVPVCLARDEKGEAVAALFSVACHPSTRYTHEISADFPGVALELLDTQLGAAAGLFLQGAAGETKASVIAKDGAWVSGSWEQVAQAGAMVADAVAACLADGLKQVEPDIRSHITQVQLPLEPAPTREALSAVADDGDEQEPRRLWAQRQKKRLDRGDALASHVPLNLHGIQLARGVRLIGLDCEPVAALGTQVRDSYGEGVTFTLGYTDGMFGYLPTSHMIEKERGYEVDSFWEYGLPARLEPGVEQVLARGLERLRKHGI
jgi:neutral ceramidase